MGMQRWAFIPSLPAGTAPPPRPCPAGGASLLALTCPPTDLRSQVFQAHPTHQAAETLSVLAQATPPTAEAQSVSAPPTPTVPPLPPPPPGRGTTPPQLTMALLLLAEGFLSTNWNSIFKTNSSLLIITLYI